MGKHSVQQRHIRKSYVRLAVDLRPEIFDEFKEACEKAGTTRTTEIKKFIEEFCERMRDK